MKKRSSLAAVLLVLALLIPWETVALAESALGIDGPCYMVISPTNSPETLSVVWWDVPEARAGGVQYGTGDFTDGEAPESVQYAAGQVTRIDEKNGYAAFEAKMTGLSPGTLCYYRTGNEGAWSEVQSFTVPQADAPDVSFMFLGDIQYDSYSTAAQDYEAWGELVRGAYSRHPGAGFAILGGDMVQQGQRADDWQMFLNQAGTVFGGLPMLAVPGNHESNDASTGKPTRYLELLAMPENGPSGFTGEFYSYDYGDCHIVALSSNIFSNEQLGKEGGMEQADFQRIADWIESDLAASDAKWKIVVMHHPAYVVVPDSVSAGVLQNWAPIFEEAQVDLVFCGHQHVYMRTKAIRGVTYVMGNSGSKHYAPADVSYAESMIGYVSNYQLVETDGDSLIMTSFDSEGSVLDSVTLEAKDRSIEPVWPSDVPGDVDGSGAFNWDDVEFLLAAIRSNAAYSEILDVSGDGKVDICDAHRLALQLTV